MGAVTAAVVGGGAIGGQAVAAERQKDAAEDAAKEQQRASERAIQSQEKAAATVRGDLAPFREAGLAALPRLTALTTDEAEQEKFLKESPLLGLISDETTRQLTARQAARGRLGSGDTATELQNRLAVTGLGLLERQQGQLFNLATLGGNVAGQQATQTQQTSNAVSNLLTGIGNARAAGEIGQANAITQGIAGATNIAASAFGGGPSGLSLSDRKMKQNIVKLSEISDGINLYKFNYIDGIDDGRDHIGLMADEVKEIDNDAVVSLGGIDYVDYGRVSTWL